MSTKTQQLATATDTAAFLLAALGNAAAWPAWLADQRRQDPDRDHPAMFGHHLYPFAIAGSSPLYRVADIKDFIAAIKAADPGLTRGKHNDYVFDDTPGLPWRIRRARRCIHLLTPPTIIGAPRRTAPGSSTPTT